MLMSTTFPDQSGPESNGNEEILHITKSSRIGITLSDKLVSFQDIRWRNLTPLQRSSRRILQPQSNGLSSHIRDQHSIVGKLSKTDLESKNTGIFHGRQYR